jgi:hypothetical protein
MCENNILCNNRVAIVKLQALRMRGGGADSDKSKLPKTANLNSQQTITTTNHCYGTVRNASDLCSTVVEGQGDTDTEPLIQSTQANASTEYEPYGITIFASEASILSKLAWPVIASYILSYSLNVASVFSLGHYGTKQLAACAVITTNTARYNVM